MKILERAITNSKTCLNHLKQFYSYSGREKHYNNDNFSIYDIKSTNIDYLNFEDSSNHPLLDYMKVEKTNFYYNDFNTLLFSQNLSNTNCKSVKELIENDTFYSSINIGVFERDFVHYFIRPYFLFYTPNTSYDILGKLTKNPLNYNKYIDSILNLNIITNKVNEDVLIFYIIMQRLYSMSDTDYDSFGNDSSAIQMTKKNLLKYLYQINKDKKLETNIDTNPLKKFDIYRASSSKDLNNNFKLLIDLYYLDNSIISDKFPENYVLYLNELYIYCTMMLYYESMWGISSVNLNRIKSFLKDSNLLRKAFNYIEDDEKKHIFKKFLCSIIEFMGMTNIFARCWFGYNSSLGINMENLNDSDRTKYLSIPQEKYLFDLNCCHFYNGEELFPSTSPDDGYYPDTNIKIGKSNLVNNSIEIAKMILETSGFSMSDLYGLNDENLEYVHVVELENIFMNNTDNVQNPIKLYDTQNNFITFYSHEGKQYNCVNENFIFAICRELFNFSNTNSTFASSFSETLNLKSTNYKFIRYTIEEFKKTESYKSIKISSIDIANLINCIDRYFDETSAMSIFKYSSILNTSNSYLLDDAIDDYSFCMNEFNKMLIHIRSVMATNEFKEEMKTTNFVDQFVVHDDYQLFNEFLKHLMRYLIENNRSNKITNPFPQNEIIKEVDEKVISSLLGIYYDLKEFNLTLDYDHKYISEKLEDGGNSILCLQQHSNDYTNQKELYFIISHNKKLYEILFNDLKNHPLTYSKLVKKYNSKYNFMTNNDLTNTTNTTFIYKDKNDSPHIALFDDRNPESRNVPDIYFNLNNILTTTFVNYKDGYNVVKDTNLFERCFTQLDVNFANRLIFWNNTSNKDNVEFNYDEYCFDAFQRYSTKININNAFYYTKVLWDMKDYSNVLTSYFNAPLSYDNETINTHFDSMIKIYDVLNYGYADLKGYFDILQKIADNKIDSSYFTDGSTERNFKEIFFNIDSPFMNLCYHNEMNPEVSLLPIQKDVDTMRFFDIHRMYNSDSFTDEFREIENYYEEDDEKWETISYFTDSIENDFYSEYNIPYHSITNPISNILLWLISLKYTLNLNKDIDINSDKFREYIKKSLITILNTYTQVTLEDTDRNADLVFDRTSRNSLENDTFHHIAFTESIALNNLVNSTKDENLIDSYVYKTRYESKYSFGHAAILLLASIFNMFNLWEVLDDFEEIKKTFNSMFKFENRNILDFCNNEITKFISNEGEK